MNKKQKRITFLIVSSFSVYCIAQEAHSGILSLPREIFYRACTPNLSTLGRFGQISHETNQYYRGLILSKNPQDIFYLQKLYSILKNDFDSCSGALVFYAKEYKNNPKENGHALTMFQHLWKYHAHERENGIRCVLGLNPIAWNHIIDVYAGGLAAEEAAIMSYETEKAKKMLAAAVKYNSEKLKNFLKDSNKAAVKTMLLADDFLFDVTQDQYCKQYVFNTIKMYTMIEYACSLRDETILSLLVNRSVTKCFKDAIISLIYCNNIELFKAFIKKNYEKAFRKRFSIWLEAIAPDTDLKKYQINFLKAIVGLLFTQDINAQDKLGRTLLFNTVISGNRLAVKFLLMRKANPRIATNYGNFPLYYAYDQPKIASLLLDHKANINQCDASGRTALMASIYEDVVTEDTYKVIELLVKKGAQVNKIDDAGKSVLDYYTDKFLFSPMSLVEKIIALLKKYGAMASKDIF